MQMENQWHNYAAVLQEDIHTDQKGRVTKDVQM